MGAPAIFIIRLSGPLRVAHLWYLGNAISAVPNRQFRPYDFSLVYDAAPWCRACSWQLALRSKKSAGISPAI
jgi:hypothetical protein